MERLNQAVPFTLSSFATLPGRAGALYRMPPPLPNRFVGGYTGSAPTAGSRGKTQGTRKAICFASTLFSVSLILHRTSNRVHIDGCNANRVGIPSMYKEESRFRERSGWFFKWPVTGLPEKTPPEGIKTIRLVAARLGSSFFLAGGWCDISSPSETARNTRPTNFSAIRRPNKFVQSSATSSHYRLSCVQKPETCHTKAPYFGIH